MNAIGVGLGWGWIRVGVRLAGSANRVERDRAVGVWVFLLGLGDKVAARATPHHDRTIFAESSCPLLHTR
jgi:hypothetical protein